MNNKFKANVKLQIGTDKYLHGIITNRDIYNHVYNHLTQQQNEK